jgi:hypothetical protein
VDPLPLLLHRFAVLDPDGLALRGDVLLQAWGWTGTADRLSFVILDDQPFLPRLRRVLLDRDLDDLVFDCVDPTGSLFRLSGPSGSALVEAIAEPCVPEPDWVEVPGGTPILGWRPETAAAWLERHGRVADLGWLTHSRDLDDDLLRLARAVRPS